MPKSMLRKNIAEYPYKTIQEFIANMSPSPTDDYTYYKIITVEGFALYVWGVDEQEILDRFQRFLDIEVFV